MPRQNQPDEEDSCTRSPECVWIVRKPKMTTTEEAIKAARLANLLVSVLATRDDISRKLPPAVRKLAKEAYQRVADPRWFWTEQVWSDTDAYSRWTSPGGGRDQWLKAIGPRPAAKPMRRPRKKAGRK